MAESMTRTGVAAGKHDIDYEGESRVIYDEYNLADYDPNADGTGNAFAPDEIYGMSRLKNVNVEVADGQPYLARYDYVNSAIRLYALDGTGEVGNNTTVDVTLRVEARGMG